MDDAGEPDCGSRAMLLHVQLPERLPAGLHRVNGPAHDSPGRDIAILAHGVGEVAGRSICAASQASSGQTSMAYRWLSTLSWSRIMVDMGSGAARQEGAEQLAKQGDAVVQPVVARHEVQGAAAEAREANRVIAGDHLVVPAVHDFRSTRQDLNRWSSMRLLLASGL